MFEIAWCEYIKINSLVLLKEQMIDIYINK